MRYFLSKFVLSFCTNRNPDDAFLADNEANTDAKPSDGYLDLGWTFGSRTGEYSFDDYSDDDEDDDDNDDDVNDNNDDNNSKNNGETDADSSLRFVESPRSPSQFPSDDIDTDDYVYSDNDNSSYDQLVTCDECGHVWDGFSQCQHTHRFSNSDTNFL